MATRHKNAVLTLVDRSTGEARSFHLDRVGVKEILPIVRANVAKESAIATDEASYYIQLGYEKYHHGTVNHEREEWVRGDVHTNTVEGYFSIFKRGMKGVYQHCSEKHLHRYLAEFDFRYSNRVGPRASTMPSAPIAPSVASRASALPIGGLVGPDANQTRRRSKRTKKL